jgi:hypothetical protein
MIVFAKVPEAGTVMELAKPELIEVETSKPLGAVTVTGDVMLVPESVKLVVEEAVPKVVLSAPSVPETTMDGLEAETVLVAVAMVWVVVPLVRAISPL